MDSQTNPTEESASPAPQPVKSTTRSDNYVAKLEAENNALRKSLAAKARQEVEASADQRLIQEKMNLGLSREQAEAVVSDQRAWDAECAREKSEK